MREVISTCPVCEHELAVTRLHCRECGTTLEGEFSVGRFSRLSRDQMRVLESFLRSRGNLKEMERDLGLSYPTVRSRVDTLVRAVGLVPFDGRGAESDAQSESPTATERRRILEALARHEIDAEGAAAQLRRLTTSQPSPAVAGTAAPATAASSPVDPNGDEAPDAATDTDEAPDEDGDAGDPDTADTSAATPEKE